MQEPGKDFRVEYISSINNVLKCIEKNGCKISDEDISNLHKCVGYLYGNIKLSGEMTRELAEELDLLFLWKD